MKTHLKISLAISFLQLMTFTTAQAVTREELAKVEFSNFNLSESANFDLFQRFREKLKNEAVTDSEISGFYKSLKSLLSHGREKANEINIFDISAKDKSIKTMGLILRLEMASKDLLLDPFTHGNVTISDQITKDNFSKIDTSKSNLIDSFEDIQKMLDNQELDLDRIVRSTGTTISLLDLVIGEVDMIYSSKDSSSNRLQNMMEVLLRFNFACERLLKKPLLDKQANAEYLRTQ